MPVVEVPLTGSQIKLYKHEALRRILAEDLNTLSGVHIGGSQLEMLLTIVRALIGNQVDPLYLGFFGLSFSETEIDLPAGTIINPDAVYRFDASTFVPTDEANWGIVEMEYEQLDTDAAVRDFWDIASQESSPNLSPTRRAYGIKLYENYSTSPSFPSVTPGRVELLRFKKTAAFGDLSEVTLSINQSFDLVSVVSELAVLHGRVDQEIIDRTAADDAKQFIRVAAGGYLGTPWYIRRDGNYSYFSESPSGPWRPFA